jgi:murein DD-endopeptidase MepM/ murein hydrolase activator NlpD
MFKKRLYTFIVGSHAGGKVWRLSLPYPVLISGGIFALVGIIGVGAGVFHYGKMLLKVVDYEYRLSENDKLRKENSTYKVQTAQLGEKIDFLDDLSRRLEFFSGMSSSKTVGGVGGISKDSLSQPRPVAAGAMQSIGIYDQKASSLETRLRGLDTQITEKVLAEAAQPSILPVKGYVTGGYGRRPDPFNPGVSESHLGVDISAPKGSRVLAPADGVIIFAGQRAGYGNIVVVDHKFGMTTRFGHLQHIDVQVGQHVSRSEIIGSVGDSGKSTGPHLHYEVWQGKRPVNPMKYLPKTG